MFQKNYGIEEEETGEPELDIIIDSDSDDSDWYDDSDDDSEDDDDVATPQSKKPKQW